jgi:hypothetical protein
LHDVPDVADQYDRRIAVRPMKMDDTVRMSRVIKEYARSALLILHETIVRKNDTELVPSEVLRRGNRR